MGIDRKITGPLLTSTSKLLILLAGLLAGLALVRILITPFTVSDDTMAPNFPAGDRIYILKWFSPKAGDVVLVRSKIEEGRVYLKRIAASGDDTVEVKDGVFFLNGTPARFSWKTLNRDNRIFPMNFSFRDNYPILRLKKGEYFVIGDNIDYSMDSRFFGVMSSDDIIGRHVYTLPYFKVKK